MVVVVGASRLRRGAGIMGLQADMILYSSISQAVLTS